MRESIAIAVTELSHTGEARRASVALANRLSFGETERGKLGIVVTEVANNLLQHAQGGVVLLRLLEHRSGIEVLALDRGPGMVDIDLCLQDGFSTTGTSGNGLGAIRRLSDLFEIYSTFNPSGTRIAANTGTAILIHLWAQQTNSLVKMNLEVGVVCLPKWGEDVSGDAWASHFDSDRSLLLVADGLGHGAAAAAASNAAVRIFQDHSQRAPSAIVEAAHAALRSTRGAALAIAEIDLTQQSVRFTGIGNIAVSILSTDQHRRLLSHNGTVGHEVRRIQEFTYPWFTDGLLVMHSDGLSSQWRLDRYPGLNRKHPSLIAGVLYRDFNRERDDVTVLVAKGTG